MSQYSRSVKNILRYTLPILFLAVLWHSQGESGDVAGATTLSDQVLAVSPSDGFNVVYDKPIDRKPEVYTGSFLYTDKYAMLKALGVEIHPEDKVFAFPEPSLGIGSQLEVYRASRVKIVDGKTSQVFYSWAKTVGDLLTERRIDIGEKDIVEPDKQLIITDLNKDVVIKITRVAETEISIKSEIPYTIKYIEDPEILRGVTKTEVEGSAGVLVKHYLVRREDGVEVSRKYLSKETIKEPVQEVIRKGTKVITYGTGKASWYGGVPALTAAHRTLPLGTRVRVVNTSNNKSVVVTIADRGPFVAGRIIDLSSDAFAQIASLGSGVAEVRVEKE